jgi:hypothetical protein
LRGVTSSDVMFMTLSNAAAPPPPARLTSASPPTKPVGTLCAFTSMCWVPVLPVASATLTTSTLISVSAPRSSQYCRWQ